MGCKFVSRHDLARLRRSPETVLLRFPYWQKPVCNCRLVDDAATVSAHSDSPQSVLGPDIDGRDSSVPGADDRTNAVAYLERERCWINGCGTFRSRVDPPRSYAFTPAWLLGWLGITSGIVFFAVVALDPSIERSGNGVHFSD